MSEFQIGRKGLKLDAPEAGDVVTVKLKPCPRKRMDSESIFHGPRQPHQRSRDGIEDESKLPQHYRHTNVWRVVATNGGQAVVEQATKGYGHGRREVWAIDAHDWYEASELLAALEQARGE